MNISLLLVIVAFAQATTLSKCGPPVTKGYAARLDWPCAFTTPIQHLHFIPKDSDSITVLQWSPGLLETHLQIWTVWDSTQPGRVELLTTDEQVFTCQIEYQQQSLDDHAIVIDWVTLPWLLLAPGSVRATMAIRGLLLYVLFELVEMVVFYMARAPIPHKTYLPPTVKMNTIPSQRPIYPPPNRQRRSPFSIQKIKQSQ